MVMNKAIFLDRDGVINRVIMHNGIPNPPIRLSDVYLITGIKELIKKWHDDGYIVIVITNQPDVANNIVTKNKVDKINKYLKSEVMFDDIFVCYHNGNDNCNCRKPKVGLFIEAKTKYNIDFSKSYMIGDRWKDMEAGEKVGCKTIFIDNNYEEKKPIGPDYTFNKVSDIGKVWNY